MLSLILNIGKIGLEDVSDPVLYFKNTEENNMINGP